MNSTPKYIHAYTYIPRHSHMYIHQKNLHVNFQFIPFPVTSIYHGDYFLVVANNYFIWLDTCNSCLQCGCMQQSSSQTLREYLNETKC